MNQMRQLRIEHNVIYDDGTPSQNICIMQADPHNFSDLMEGFPDEELNTATDMEGICSLTKKPVTYHESYIRTSKTDDELRELFTAA